MQDKQKIKLSNNLETFPSELFQLTASLEYLDLTGNNLSSLPDDFYKFEKLKILFLSDNQFEKFPEVLAHCKNLDIIGFKNNKIKTIEENSFPEHLRWLILTNNQLEQIPKSIGKCFRLQKLMLAGNRLNSLPKDLSNCKNLELIRIAANQLEEFPEHLLSLPKLSWIALAANPCIPQSNQNKSFPEINWEDIEVLEKIGSGASGDIYKAKYKNVNIAVKIFKSGITSDGYPIDEMSAYLEAGYHPTLTKVQKKIINHPETKEGIVLDLIPSDFIKIGEPPDFLTCTRDTFQEGITFSKQEVLQILLDISSAINHLHSKNILHGDLYAHNMMFQRGNLKTLLGDFGAATILNIETLTADKLKKIETRAFGHLIEDLITRLGAVNKYKLFLDKIMNLHSECMRQDIMNRPSFSEINSRLTDL